MKIQNSSLQEVEEQWQQALIKVMLLSSLVESQSLQIQNYTTDLNAIQSYNRKKNCWRCAHCLMLAAGENYPLRTFLRDRIYSETKILLFRAFERNFWIGWEGQWERNCSVGCSSHPQLPSPFNGWHRCGPNVLLLAQKLPAACSDYEHPRPTRSSDAFRFFNQHAKVESLFHITIHSEHHRNDG